MDASHLRIFASVSHEVSYADDLGAVYRDEELLRFDGNHYGTHRLRHHARIWLSSRNRCLCCMSRLVWYVQPTSH